MGRPDFVSCPPYREDGSFPSKKERIEDETIICGDLRADAFADTGER